MTSANPEPLNSGKSGPPTSKGFFYGWVILGAGFTANALNSGFWSLGMGAFFLPVAETFGASKTALAGAFSLARLETAVLGPFQGFLVDRLGSRKMMFGGVMLMGAGFLLLGSAPNLVWFYIIFVGLIAVGQSVGLGASVYTAVVNWFVRRRTKALALVLSGMAFGGLIVPGIAWSIEEFGWERTSFIAGLIILGIGLPLASLMRSRPEEHGYHPDGLPPREPSRAVSLQTPVGDFGVREALRTPQFWLINGFFALRMLSTTSIPVHLIAFLEGDLEFGTTRAALYLGLIGPLGLGGRLVFGMMGDAIPKSYAISAAVLLQALGLGVFAVADGTLLVLVALVLFATGHAGGGPLFMSIHGEYFGRRNYATIQGFASAVILMGAVTGPVVAGALADNVEDGYRYAWITFAIMGFVAASVLAFVRPPVQRRLLSGVRQEGVKA